MFDESGRPAAPPEVSLTDSPFRLFRAWMDDAKQSEPNDPNAMTLATSTPEGRPSARIVLLKALDDRGFTFFTNTLSRKGEELAADRHAALLFHWKTRRRQVRVEGTAEPVSAAEADDYFNTRARISRLGAIASEQSRVLPARSVLEERVRAADARHPGDDVPRPQHWSGYRVLPASIEFWQDMPFRLHDRTVFVQAGVAQDGGGWTAHKLYP